MKKIFALILAMVLCIGLLAACGSNGDDAKTDNTAAKNVKLGFIFLHDENSTYDLNFMNGAKEACAALGLSEDQYLFRTNIP